MLSLRTISQRLAYYGDKDLFAIGVSKLSRWKMELWWSYVLLNVCMSAFKTEVTFRLQRQYKAWMF